MRAAQELPGSPRVGLEARRGPFEVVRQRQSEAVLTGFHEADPSSLRRGSRFNGLSEEVQRIRLEQRGFPERLLAAHGLRWALVLEVREAAGGAGNRRRALDVHRR